MAPSFLVSKIVRHRRIQPESYVHGTEYLAVSGAKSRFLLTKQDLGPLVGRMIACFCYLLRTTVPRRTRFRVFLLPLLD